jgi:hypothetical protein
VIGTDFKKAPTVTVLNSVLPRILFYDATYSGQHRHYAEGNSRNELALFTSLLCIVPLLNSFVGPLPVNTVMKAKDQLLRPENNCITRSGTRVRISFNSEKAMVLAVAEDNLAASPVTDVRWKRYAST